MGNVELVIKIDEEIYQAIKTGNRQNYKVRNIALIAIENGTPLKEHGRLGDLAALETEMVNGIHAGNCEEGYEDYDHINNMDDCVECVKYADTIIEATENH